VYVAGASKSPSKIVWVRRKVENTSKEIETSAAPLSSVNNDASCHQFATFIAAFITRA
jgi:hypothetical protein